jgi:lysozyme family protein
MSNNFDYSIPFIFDHEKNNGRGWCDVAGDSGGETYIGVSRNNFPHWSGWDIVDSLRTSVNFPRCLDSNAELQERVREFYQANFWQSSWDSLDKRVAAKTMDISVNNGISWGPKILQRAAGVADDGIIGPATLAAANAIDPVTLCQSMADKLIEHYEAIVADHHEDQKFLAGWKNRSAWIPA